MNSLTNLCGSIPTPGLTNEMQKDAAQRMDTFMAQTV